MVRSTSLATGFPLSDHQLCLLQSQFAILDEIRKIDIIIRSIRDKTSELEEKIRELHLRLGRMPEEEEVAQALGMNLEEYHKLLESIKGISFIDIEALKQRMPDLEEEDILNFYPEFNPMMTPLKGIISRNFRRNLKRP